MFFQEWSGLLRVVVVGTLGYVALLLILRGSGKRTLSKLNAFDLVVTVALGSTLATVLLSKDVALAEGVTAFALLAFLQLAITWASTRSATVRRLVKAEPTLLVHNGHMLEQAMARERVTHDEVLQALRAEGIGSVAEALALVIETDGSFSALPSTPGPAPSRSTLSNVRGV